MAGSEPVRARLLGWSSSGASSPPSPREDQPPSGGWVPSGTLALTPFAFSETRYSVDWTLAWTMIGEWTNHHLFPRFWRVLRMPFRCICLSKSREGRRHGTLCPTVPMQDTGTLKAIDHMRSWNILFTHGI